MSVVLATGPIPGMERKIVATSARALSFDMVTAMRSSRQFIRLSNRAFRSASMSSNRAAMPRLLLRPDLGERSFAHLDQRRSL